MTTYITQDGTKLTAKSATELVEKMQEKEAIAAHNLQEFLNAVARRYQIKDNVLIRVTSPETFIADLIQYDYVRAIDPLDG